MQCPFQDCDYEGTLRYLEKHRQEEHGDPEFSTTWRENDDD